jgi:hypothetical protein
MKSRILFLSTMVAVSAGMAAGADPKLLSLVMPDAQVIAGVNVEQAKTTPFGQWVLSQMQSNDRELQSMSAAVGFDPRRDVRELLIATPGGSDPKSGIALARGTFDVAKISAAAAAAGVVVEQYNGVPIITDPKKQGSFAFPDGTTAVVGTPEIVRAAIDRRNRTTGAIAPALAAKVSQLSATQDAWAITMVPPSTLPGPFTGRPPQAGPGQQPAPGGQQHLPQDMLQKIQQASGGVKFGDTVTFTGEAVTASAQDASSMAGVVQFLANMATAQSKDPNAASLVKGLVVNAQGPTVKIALSLPQSQFEQMVRPRQGTGRKKAQ